MHGVKPAILAPHTFFFTLSGSMPDLQASRKFELPNILLLQGLFRRPSPNHLPSFQLEEHGGYEATYPFPLTNSTLFFCVDAEKPGGRNGDSPHPRAA